jgi:hypothetical protein
MARSDPEKLAQALRANLRRRKSAPAAANPPPPAPPPEPAQEKPRPDKG